VSVSILSSGIFTQTRWVSYPISQEKLIARHRHQDKYCHDEHKKRDYQYLYYTKKILGKEEGQVMHRDGVLNQTP
jgi:hypothetical protein